VVEVISAGNSRMEHAAKLKDYKSLGVPEVWVVSPGAKTVEVLLLKGGRLTANAPLREGRLQPTYFPGVAVDIASIWPE
jgi:Uma2 family endonuclease